MDPVPAARFLSGSACKKSEHVVAPEVEVVLVVAGPGSRTNFRDPFVDPLTLS
jgi:hypothetical protein